MYKKRSILKNLGWALATTPMVFLVGLVIITLIGAIGDVITKIQSAGYWWVIPIVAYILSLVYYLFEPDVRKNIERRKIVNALILYLKEKLEKQGRNQPTNSEIALAKDMLLERFKMWAWFDKKLWNKYFPDEQYSKSLFGIVDNYMVYWDQQKIKYTKK